MEVENHKCSNCGGSLIFDPTLQKLVCEYCQSSFEIKDEEIDEQTKKENEEYCEYMHQYRCTSCGATMVIGETTASTNCVYCHSPITISGKLEGEVKPHKIIPFQYDVEQTKKILEKHIKKHFFIPKDFYSPNQLENIKGVYYPFWIVDIDLNASADFRAVRSTSWTTGNYRYTKTSTYNLYRAGDIHLEDVASCAINNVDRNMLEGIFPFPKDAYLDFNKSYLVGHLAQKRDLEKKQILPDVHHKIKIYSIEQLKSDCIGMYGNVTHSNYRSNVIKEDWSYVLLPIYILTYIKNDKTYIYAMNGYNGKVYGEYPISFIKISLLFIAIFLIGVIIGLVVYL